MIRTELLALVMVTAGSMGACRNSAVAPAQPSTPTPASTTGVAIFFDDFRGTSIDAAKWTVLDRLSDQANGEVNCVGPQNVSVKDGFLEVVSRFEDRTCGDTVEPPKALHYTSGQIQQATAPFLYGTIEVRAKAPGGGGTWPAIWMLGFEWQASQPFTANTPEHKWPKAGWCEIDIAEFLQGERKAVNTTVHYNQHGGQHTQELPFDAATRFMVYRLQWTQGSLIWSIDAEDGRGFRKLHSVSGATKVPDVPMFVVIHTAVGGIGGGSPDPGAFPQSFQVDYVRVTQ